MNLTRLRHHKVLIAAAFAVPIVAGSVAVANAATNDGSGSDGSVVHSTSRLTPAGQQAAEKSGDTSGTVQVGPDGVTVDGKKVSSMSVALPDGTTSTSGSARLTPEGLKLVRESGKTSGSISVGPNSNEK